MRERERCFLMWRLLRRERERYKAAAKKRKKSGHLCFRFWLSHDSRRKSERLAKAMNVGALFAHIWFPGKKQPTNNTASDIKKSN